jgi:hypothetical protein
MDFVFLTGLGLFLLLIYDMQSSCMVRKKAVCFAIGEQSLFQPCDVITNLCAEALSFPYLLLAHMLTLLRINLY